MIGEMILEACKSGRTPAAVYYAGSALRGLRLRRWLCARREKLLSEIDSRPDAEYIRERADFYCRLEPGWRGDGNLKQAVRIGDLKRGCVPDSYFDLQRVLRWFPADCTASFQGGESPALVKSRIIGKNDVNSVLLPLDRRQQWRSPHDFRPFGSKCPKLVYRGSSVDNPAGRRFLERWHGHELMDLGATERHPVRPEWKARSITEGQMLDFQFVLCLEEGDIASGLQWIMASRCVPVMPRPTRESWLMHSRLEAGVHYAEIKPDFSDAGRVVEWLAVHPHEAQAIAEASAQWVQQFADPHRELLIQLLVGRRYLLGE